MAGLTVGETLAHSKAIEASTNTLSVLRHDYLASSASNSTLLPLLALLIGRASVGYGILGCATRCLFDPTSP